ncbi:hypothetical protein PFISCL1PPCAC_12697, partial [Pristionchus fissidentatus]
YTVTFCYSYQTYYCITAALTWHPAVLYLLIRKPGPLSKDIRHGYIANQLSFANVSQFFNSQLTLMLNEWIFCLLIRVYPLVPYPALHCGGLLCGRGIHPQILLTILAIGVVCVNPPFEFLLLTMHQKLVSNTTSRVHFSRSCRTQHAMIFALTAALMVNVVGFGVLGQRTKKAEELLNRPELAWVKERHGEVFIFGDMYDAESFQFG